MTTANSVTSEDTTTTEGVGDSKVESSDTRQAEAKVDADSPTTLSSGCGDADQPSPPNVTANADESNEAEVTATSNTNEKTNPIPDTAKSIVASESAATDSVSNDDGAVKEKNGESNSAPTLGTTVSESGGSETEPTRKRKMSRWGAPPKKKRKNRWGNKKPASALSNLMQLNGGLAANTAMASAMFGTKEWDEKQTKIMILRQKLQVQYIRDFACDSIRDHSHCHSPRHTQTNPFAIAILCFFSIFCSAVRCVVHIRCNTGSVDSIDCSGSICSHNESG